MWSRVKIEELDHDNTRRRSYSSEVRKLNANDLSCWIAKRRRMGGKNGWVGAARGGVGPPLFLVDEKAQPNRNLLAVAATSV